MELACASIPHPTPAHVKSCSQSPFRSPLVLVPLLAAPGPSSGSQQRSPPHAPHGQAPQLHPDTPTALSCLLPGPPPSHTDFSGFPRAAPGHARWDSEHWSSLQSSPRLATQPQPRAALPHHAEQPLQSRDPLPGSLCTRWGHGAELSCWPGGHSQPGTGLVPHSPQLPGHCGGRAAKAAAQSPPLHRDARSSAARLLASCTCRYVPAPPSPQLGQPNPWPRCQGYQSLLL